jgi:hypothetical protein
VNDTSFTSVPASASWRLASFIDIIGHACVQFVKMNAATHGRPRSDLRVTGLPFWSTSANGGTSNISGPASPVPPAAAAASPSAGNMACAAWRSRFSRHRPAPTTLSMISTSSPQSVVVRIFWTVPIV